MKFDKLFNEKLAIYEASTGVMTPQNNQAPVATTPQSPTTGNAANPPAQTNQPQTTPNNQNNNQQTTQPDNKPPTAEEFSNIVGRVAALNPQAAKQLVTQAQNLNPQMFQKFVSHFQQPQNNQPVQQQVTPKV